MKILVIEDDTTTAESIRLCFEIYEPEYIVSVAEKGSIALQMLKQEHYDGVIIDLGLPDIDGIDVLEKVRDFSRIPILVLSARHAREMVQKALAVGADDYITKPYNYRNLLDRLNKLVNRPLETESKNV